MTIKTSTYNGFPDGTVVTAGGTGNSDDNGDEQIPAAIFVTAGGAITFSTEQSHTPDGSIKIVCNSTTNACYFGYGADPAADASFREQLYVYFVSWPTASMRLLAGTTTGASTLWRVQLSTAGVLSLVMTGTATAASALSLNTWYRIDVTGSGFNSSSTAVTVAVRNGPDDTGTAFVTMPLTGQTTTGLMGRTQLGNCSGVNVGAATMYFDDVRSEIDTSSTAFTPMPIPVSITSSDPQTQTEGTTTLYVARTGSVDSSALDDASSLVMNTGLASTDSIMSAETSTETTTSDNTSDDQTFSESSSLAMSTAIAGSNDPQTLTEASSLIVGSVGAFSSAGTLSGTNQVAGFSGALSLTGAGTLNSAGQFSFASTGALSGSGTFSGFAVSVYTAQSNAFTGIGTLIGAGKPTASGTVGMSGDGILGLLAPGYANLYLSGLGALQGVSGSTAGIVNYSGSGTLGLSAVPAAIASAALSGPGTLSLSSSASPAGSVLLTGLGGLSGTGISMVTSTLVLSGLGAISAQGVFSSTGVVSFSGSGQFNPSGLGTSYGSATFMGSGAYSGIGIPGGITLLARYSEGTLTSQMSFLGVKGAALNLQAVGLLNGLAIKTEINSLAVFMDGSGVLTAESVFGFGADVQLSGTGEIKFLSNTARSGFAVAGSGY